MVKLHVGVGDRLAIGVRVDQQVLPARGLQGELDRGVQQLVCNKRRPRPKPGAVTAAKGWSERFLCMSSGLTSHSLVEKLAATAVARPYRPTNGPAVTSLFQRRLSNTPVECVENHNKAVLQDTAQSTCIVRPCRAWPCGEGSAERPPPYQSARREALSHAASDGHNREGWSSPTPRTTEPD